MKKTDTLIKITSLLVFIALAAYLSVYIASRAMNSVQTALTVTATMSDSAPLTGLVIRDELVIRSEEPYIDVTAPDGAKVAAGETVAVSYSSEEALERASRLHVLSQELEDVRTSLDSAGGVKVTGDREQSIYAAIEDISSCVHGLDLSEMDSRSATLAGILFPTEADSAVSTEHLDQLQAEYDELRKTSAGDTSDITVGESGVFSTLVDGYEGVDMDYAADLTPTGLRKLIAADRVVEDSSIGKIITSYSWYYAAIIPWEAGQHLLEGDAVKLSFGRYYSGSLDAEVAVVGRAEHGEQVVIFRIEQGQADMLAVRAVSAELVYREFTGLRVPLKGLYRYYAGYMSADDGGTLTSGDTVTLSMGGVDREAFVSEVGSASRYGELPQGVESGSEEDTRPQRRLVVFCWPWSAEEEPINTSAGAGTVTVYGREPMNTWNFYDYDPEDPDSQDRLCVFTMTGLQAERKLVDMVFAGEEYCLLSSEGTDALREGNDVIIQAHGLYNGRVFS